MGSLDLLKGYIVMDRNRFVGMLKEAHERELRLNQTKGVEYAGREDALANFKQAGEFIKTTCPYCGKAHSIGALPALMAYAFKHFCSMASYAALGEELSDEDISGRVDDLRLYTALFSALAYEEKCKDEEIGSGQWILDQVQFDAVMALLVSIGPDGLHLRNIDDEQKRLLRGLMEDFG
jgi:hypothetical protein